MKPETAAYLDRADRSLSNARAILAINIAEAAGREAYYAAFHAAEALIFERTDKTPKTHSGVRAEFNRLAMDEPAISPELRAFLGQSYRLKEAADYLTGSAVEVTQAQAAAAVDSAGEFVTCVRNVLTPSQAEGPPSPAP